MTRIDLAHTPPPEIFIIFAMPRTGSNMLVTALNSHPAIRCHGELFVGRDLKPGMELFDTFSTIYPAFRNKEYRYKNAERLLRSFIDKCDKPRFGFKLMLNQHPELIAEIVHGTNWPIILLRRENELACYSSHLIAKTTGQGIARIDDNVKTAKAVFDEQQFSSFRKQRNRKYEQFSDVLAAANRTAQSIDYRSLLTGSGYAQVLKLLGVDQDFELITGTRKRNPNNVVERFTNTETVSRYLQRENLEDWSFEQPFGA